jgi:hypothetical protein
MCERGSGFAACIKSADCVGRAAFTPLKPDKIAGKAAFKPLKPENSSDKRHEDRSAG